MISYLSSTAIVWPCGESAQEVLGKNDHLWFSAMHAR